MELRAVRGIDFIAAIGRAGRDHANRRSGRFHGADLDGGSVGAEQTAVRQIECVLLVARGMIGRRVERVEAMPFIFDVGAIGQREAHAPENLDAAFEHLGEGMQRAAFARCARQRDVDVSERGRFFCARNFSDACSSAVVTALRTSLSNFPTIGFSSLPSVFICSPHAEMVPLRPR